ncbi:epimerase, partial [Streptomyces sp. 4F]
EVAAIRHLMEREDLSGPFNLTAPRPVTNREITVAMGRVLRRPAPFAVPAPVLRAVLGEMAGDVLGSARVLPARLQESGFRFAFPEIDGAIRAAL